MTVTHRREENLTCQDVLELICKMVQRIKITKIRTSHPERQTLITQHQLSTEHVNQVRVRNRNSKAEQAIGTIDNHAL